MLLDLSSLNICSYDNNNRRPTHLSGLRSMNRAVVSVQQTMARHPYISTALIVLVLNLFGNFVKSGNFMGYQRQYASQPSPTNFFSLQSPVIDYPYGNLADVGDILQEEDALFVMFYAPWCARSMELKHEYEKAAKFFENEILFVAINCWHRTSECRQRNAFMSFPVFYFYVNGQEGYKYSGVPRADFMVEFILRMLHPISYITSQQKLAEFVSERDTSVVGYFNFSSTEPPPSFTEFYRAALQTTEKDPKNVIPFGVLTSQHLATLLDISDSPSVILVRSLNDSFKFPQHLNFTATTLSAWALASRQQPVVKWIFPSGAKSLVLSSELRHGPAVVLFLPAMPLSSTNHYIALLRQVALTYRNCNQSAIVNGLVTTNMFKVAKNFLQHQVLEKQCEQLKPTETSKPPRQRPPLKSCCMSLTSVSCQFCVHYQNSHPLSIQGCQIISSSSFNFSRFQDGKCTCSATRRNYNPDEYVSCCCKGGKLTRHADRLWSDTPNEDLDDENVPIEDWFVLERARHSVEMRCRQLKQLKSFGWEIQSLDESDARLLSHHDYPDDFVGLGCGSNRTVRFFAMDSDYSDVFLTSLGLDLKLPADRKVTMVLYDFKNEVLHVMKEEFLFQNLLAFVQNFTSGSLAAFRRTAQIPSGTSACHEDASRVCAVEVTSKTFRKIVLDDSKDVLLLYYAPWCGFCAGFSHVFLMLAHYFRSVENIVFARINGDGNDIPWQYTVSEYPTLIFFPAHSKSNSVLFPPHQPKTLPNLVRFVLRWSSNAIILDSKLNFCGRDCISINQNMSAVHIESLLLEIESTSQDLLSTANYREILETQLGELAKTTDSEEYRLLLNKLRYANMREDSLREKLLRARLKLDSTKHLHGILQSSLNQYSLDRDALLSVVRQNLLQRNRLKTYEVL